MLWLISFASFVSIFILVYLLLRTVAPIEEAAEIRLHEMSGALKGRKEDKAEKSPSFIRKILMPLSGPTAARFPRIAPAGFQHKVADQLTMAGGFGGLGANEFLLLTTLTGLLCPLLIAGFLYMERLPLHKVIGFALLSSVLGFYLPVLLLHYKIAARRHSMQLALPDALDLITVSVEAGLGFEGALVKLSEKMKGPLVDEFTRTLNEMRIGVPRRDALTAMGERCSLPDIRSFTMSMVQADQLGISIGNVLRVKSAAIREKRQQGAEELAMKAPVKMLFPLVFFIFPAIFIVLLGPSLIKIVDAFSKR